MSVTIKLFEQYKLVVRAETDRSAAQKLGIKSQTVSNWRTRGSQAEPWLVEIMCIALGYDPVPWLVRSLTEQAATPRNRSVWERVVMSLQQEVSAKALAVSGYLVGLSRLTDLASECGEPVATNFFKLSSTFSALSAAFSV